MRFGPGHSPTETKTLKTLENPQKLRKLSQKKLSTSGNFVLSVSRTFCRRPAHFGRLRKVSFWIFQYRFSQMCLDLKRLQCPDLYVGNSSLYCFPGQRPRRARMSNRKSKMYGSPRYTTTPIPHCTVLEIFDNHSL